MSGSCASAHQVDETTRRDSRSEKPNHTLSVSGCFLSDFPAGRVKVTVYSDGAPLSRAEVQYYSNVEAMSSLLEGAADPVDFMCQVKQLKARTAEQPVKTSCRVTCWPLWVAGPAGAVCGQAGSQVVLHAAEELSYRRLPGPAA